MNTVARTLWFIESHLAEELSLDTIAERIGLSPFHLTRVFALATGRSVMRYVRGRRLTEAAHALACGSPNILSVALDSGYGSHEAFSRAFREQFGLTPESVRDRRHVQQLDLVEAMRMDANSTLKINPIRFEDFGPLLLAGLGTRYDCNDKAGIPAQWQRFSAHLGHIPGQVGAAAYGVCSNFDSEGNFDYLCAVEVRDISGLGPALTHLRLESRRYAVFAHRDHVASIGGTWNAIWSQWLPGSEYEAPDAPVFEKYGQAFNPATGLGGFELWVPVKKK